MSGSKLIELKMNTMKSNIFLSIIVIFFTGCFNNMIAQCPSLVYLPAQTECGSGDVIISLAECSNPSDAQLDHVTWDFGDGSATVETTDLTVNYTYSTSNHYNIAAVGTYVLQDGSTCTVQALRAFDAITNNDLTLEQICQNTNYANLYFIPIIVLEGYLSLNPSDPIQAGTNYDIVFTYTGTFTPPSSANFIVIIDGNTVATGTMLPASGSTIYTTTFTEGQHVIEYVIDNKGRTCNLSFLLIIDVPPPPPPCEDCFTFKPEPGKRYWVSAWVKENHASQVLNYADAAVQIAFNGSTSTPVTFHTTGEIIDGWQRIVGDFVIPLATLDIDINLLNNNGAVDAYYDDIRIHPFNASMKSYVYDPVTFLLSAELDDNNYATFYEYDKEGQLIRIKKETARGIMTIQESRSSNPKN